MHDRRQHPPQLRLLADEPEQHRRELAAVALGGGAQGIEVDVVERSRLAHQARMDLALRQQPGRRLQDRPAQLEGVLRELEAEEARLPLLELRRSGQHVVGQPRRLGHRDVEHHDQVELLERRAHPLRVGQRVRGVGALDDHRPQAPRVVGQDLLGDRVAGQQADDDPLARDRRLCVTPEVAAQLGDAAVQVHAAGVSEVAGQQEEQLLEVGVERRVRRLLDAEVLEDGDALRLRQPARDRAHQILFEPGAPAVLGDRHALELGEQRLAVTRMLGQELGVEQLLLDEHAQQRREAERVHAWAHLEVEVRHRRGLRAARVDHDQRAGRILGDLLEDDARAREAVRVPGVLADEHRDLGTLEVRSGVTARAAEQLTVDPRLAGLLLCERVRHVADAERGAGRRRIRAAEVVALAAAAVVEDRLAAVLVADRAQPRGDLAHGGVPVDLLEGAVRAAAQRCREAVAGVLVVVEALRLLARVAVRARTGLVAAHAHDAAVGDLHLDPAVEAAEDARGLPPLRGNGLLGDQGHGRDRTL